MFTHILVPLTELILRQVCIVLLFCENSSLNKSVQCTFSDMGGGEGNSVKKFLVYHAMPFGFVK